MIIEVLAGTVTALGVYWVVYRARRKEWLRDRCSLCLNKHESSDGFITFKSRKEVTRICPSCQHPLTFLEFAPEVHMRELARSDGLVRKLPRQTGYRL